MNVTCNGENDYTITATDLVWRRAYDGLHRCGVTDSQLARAIHNGLQLGKQPAHTELSYRVTTEEVSRIFWGLRIYERETLAV